MKVGIIADDLTGANATGVLLSKNGFNSATAVFGERCQKRVVLLPLVLTQIVDIVHQVLHKVEC